MYKCYRIFLIEQTLPAVGGENSFQAMNITSQVSSPVIVVELCCFKETANYSLLILVCNNGYILFYLQPFLCKPIIKQVKWFESRSQHILDVTLDPLGEWLACACLDGCVYLLPVLSLMMQNCSPSHVYGPLDDIVQVKPIQKVAPPTSIVWWDGMDGSQVCITGSELGEITFFDLHELKETYSIGLRGCINQLLISQQVDHITHLLVNLRGGEWWLLLLEERYREAADTSYTDVQADGFEVVFDDAVLRSILISPDLPCFVISLLPDFSEYSTMTVQDLDKPMLGVLHLRDKRFELLNSNLSPAHSFNLSNKTTNVQANERLLFAISHNDEVNDCTFTLSVISRIMINRSTRSNFSNALLQQFELPSDSDIVGFFTTKLESSFIAAEPHDLYSPSNLGGCIIVTSNAVYQCYQTCSPESVFLEVALRSNDHNHTDDIAVAHKLDVNSLYKAAAECKMNKKDYSSALNLYQHSQTLATEVIKSFLSKERIHELMIYLQRIVYDESNLHMQISPSTKPKLLQDVLLKCYIHQCLESDSMAVTMEASLAQFINDKFLYDHGVAMNMLNDCGMLAPLLELAKAHLKIPEAFQLIIAKGSSHLPDSLEHLIANRQFSEYMHQAGNELLFFQLKSFNIAKCVISQPNILEFFLSHLISVIPELEENSLLQLVHLLDPSSSTIQPLLLTSHASLKRSSSTGSIVSLISTESFGTDVIVKTHSLPAYIEAFLYTLIILHYKREQKPQKSTGLMSLSPLNGKFKDKKLKSIAVFADGSQLFCRNTISSGTNHAALVTNGELYTWGSTRNGKLGHGDIEQHVLAAPLKVETFSMLSVHVLSVSCGAESTIALCQEGVFSWGSSTHGQLGHGDTLKRTRPVQIASLANIPLLTIKCGHYHCLALDENHRVWVWGWGIHGQLGLGISDDILSPTHALGMDCLLVSFIAAGFNHSAILSHEGKLYTFGNGMYGQLGHGSQEKQLSPCLVEALAEKIVYLVSCGTSHTLAVSSDQFVYHWGKNLHKPHPGSSPQSLKQYTRSRREGATSPAVSNALLPVHIHGQDFNDIVVEIDCGNSHCLLLLASGSVLSWGSNMHGQIGHTHIPELSQPKYINKLDDHHILSLCCGDDHSIAIDDAGITWVWGRDDLGQLGMEFSGVKEGKKVCIFAPNPNPQIPLVSFLSSINPYMSLSDPLPEDSLLHLDLGWSLPPFANIDSISTYGRDTCSAALKSLYGYYRCTPIMYFCKHWNDYQSLVDICTKQKQWQHALYWRLCHLIYTKQLSLDLAISSVKDCFSNWISESTHLLYTRKFIVTTCTMLYQVITFWKEHGLGFGPLENTFRKFLPSLTYSLSLIFKRCGDYFSFKFCVEVTLEHILTLQHCIPPVEEILNGNLPSGTTTTPFESSTGDCRLWTEVMRNVVKDLSKRDHILLLEPQLSQLDYNDIKSLTIFSCGHTFTEKDFQRSTLSEFYERLHDLPQPLINFTSFLLHYYKQSTNFSSSCPYCIFHHLRTTQLQVCPGIPIKPWNP